MNSINCIVCIDLQYNKPGPSYICDKCIHDKTLVCKTFSDIGLPYLTYPKDIPYCSKTNMYPIDRFLDGCLILFKDNKKRLKRIEKCKEEYKIKRKDKIENDYKKVQIIENIKIATSKFSIKLDFETNSVKNIIDKQINDIGIDNTHLLAVIINELYDYTLNIDNLIAERVAILDKIIDEYPLSYKLLDTEIASFRNQLKEYPPIKSLYDEFCVNDKGYLQSIKTSLMQITSSAIHSYVMALHFNRDLEKYGIKI